MYSNALGEGGIVVNHYDNLSDTVKLCSMYDTLLACGYKGFVGYELFPLTDTKTAVKAIMQEC